MPRAIADSDDEGDDLFHDDETAEVLPKDGPGAAVAVDTMDGTDERSTGSTERLRRQLQSAERGLVSNAPSVEMMAASSPSVRASKRRHTSIFGSGSAEGLEKSLKRTKTGLKTFGSKHRSHVPENEEPMPRTSQSARFTEHSSINSSAGLPSGFVKEDFLNHEPAVMFRDSGSTVADNSSEQQRLLQQALASNKGLSTSAINALQADDRGSSSIPWSTSEQTHSAKSCIDQQGERQGTKNQQLTGNDAKFGNLDNGESDAPIIFNVGGKDLIEHEVHVEHDQDTRASQNSRTSSAASHPRPSPEVEIPSGKGNPTTASHESTVSTQKAPRGRKRKVDHDESSEPLNSDDRAIGLPKERYQPRPSRRRATQIAEEPVDLSVRPEKAAKVKRTKTTPGKTEVTSLEADSEVSGKEASPEMLKAILDKLGSISPDKPFASAVATSDQCNDTNAQKTLEQSTDKQVTEPDFNLASSVKHHNEEEIFVKPAKPTPKPKSSTKTKRSHTTIFEDHVEFTSSQKSPSLRQQQASRELTLQEVQNGSTAASGRKRKTIVDDDEEDELAQGPREAQQDSPPKKRGRGRPAKSTSKPEPKSAERILEDSEDDQDHQSEPDKARKKRGRPSKAEIPQPKTNPQTESKAATEPSPPAEQPRSNATGQNEKPRDNTSATEPPTKATNPPGSMPTPSPEKSDTGKTAGTPQKDAKKSPALHSPIKSSLSVPLRVGLSRRNRIPPLLRMVRGPKR